MASTILIIDGHNLAHRMYHQPQLKRLRRSDGKPSGVFYGFLSSLSKLITKFKPIRVICCADGFGASARKAKTHEGYKAGRKKARKSLYRQIEDIKSVLSALGLVVMCREGIEADDLMWHVAKYLSDPTKVDLKKDDRIILVTADHDMLQCINDYVRVYDDRQKKLWDDKLTTTHYKVAPNQIGLFKALAGDKSDNIKGVHGIGPAATVKFIRKGKDAVGVRKRLSREQRQEFDVSLSLVQISPNTQLMYYTQESLKKKKKQDIGNIKNMLRKYSCNSFLTKFDLWVETFEKVR